MLPFKHITKGKYPEEKGKVLGIPLNFRDEVKIDLAFQKVLETITPKLAPTNQLTYSITTNLEIHFTWTKYITELFNLQDVVSSIGGVYSSISLLMSIVFTI